MYLDAQGLVALWRETLLAQAVLRGETRGYRHHPQLERFKSHSAPLAAISLYLRGIHDEACARGYTFDGTKIRPVRRAITLTVTEGQVAHEWDHLLRKLKARNPDMYMKWRAIDAPQPHSLFSVCAGRVEPWERLSLTSEKAAQVRRTSARRT